MANPVQVTFDGTVLSAAESTTDNGTWEEWDRVKTPTLESDIVYQNVYAISLKVSSTNNGIAFIDDATVDLTTPKVILSTWFVTTPGAVDITLADGIAYRIGSSKTDYYGYFLYGLYNFLNGLPARSGWEILAIDPNEAAFRDEEVGTPDLANADTYGPYLYTVNASKSENLIADILSRIDVGDGLTLTGGTGGSTPGNFADFVDEDEGDDTQRWSVVSTGEDEIVVRGKLTIGNDTGTGFDDSGFLLVFPWERVGVGFMGMELGLQSTGTDIDFEAGIFRSLGQSDRKVYFDTVLSVSGGGDLIEMPSTWPHWLSTGNYVRYSKEGGAKSIGLTDDGLYFVHLEGTGSLQLYASGASTGRQNAFAGGATGRMNLTAATGIGEEHSLTRLPDNRADYTVTGASGDAYWDACQIDGFRSLKMTTAAEFNGGALIRGGNIDLNGGTLDGARVTEQTTVQGEALIDPLLTLDTIKRCTFILTQTAPDREQGHAMRLTATGDTNLDECEFDGYWAPSANGWLFHTISGINGPASKITTQAAHGFKNGEPVYYNNEGGSDTVGLTNAERYYAGRLSGTAFTLHNTRRAALDATMALALTTGASGEYQALYSGNAVLFNDSAGPATVRVLNQGDLPSVRNGTGASTTVLNIVNLTLKAVDIDGNAVSGAQAAIFRADDNTQLMNEDTTASGIATEEFNYSEDTPINIRIRKSSPGDTRYFPYGATGEITELGFTSTVTLYVDTTL
jgi:hypothetical protein